MNEKRLYKAGLLLASQTESRHFLYTDNPTEDLDLARLLDGKSDCYRLPVPLQTPRKKHIIITDTSFVFGLASAEVRNLWLELLRESFEISVWVGDLEPVTNAQTLDLLLCNVQPVYHEDLLKILAEKNIASDSCYLAGTGQTKELLRDIFDQEPDYTLPVSRLLELPEEAMLGMLRCIPNSPQIGLKFVNPENVSCLLFSEYLSRHPFADFTCRTLEELESFLESCPNLEKLILRMKKFLENIPSLGLPASLKHLDLQNMLLSREQLGQILPLCPKLEALKLGQLRTIRTPRESITLSHLTALLPESRLKILQLKNLDTSEDSGVLPFLASLTDFRIGSSTIRGDKLSRLITACGDLGTLALTFCEIAGEIPELSTLASLIKLDLTGSKINTRQLVTLLNACPKLEILILNNCTELRDLSGIHLPAGLKCLVFSATHSSGKQISELIAPCKMLESLNISADLEREDSASIRLPASLTSLDCSMTKITGQQFAQLIAPCPNLRKINLSRCSSLVDMSDIGVLESLIGLNLANTQLSQEQYARFLASCPNLEILNLADIARKIDISALPLPQSLTDCNFAGEWINAGQLQNTVLPCLVRLVAPAKFTQPQLESWPQLFNHLQVLELPDVLMLPVSVSVLAEIKNSYPWIRVECPNAVYHSAPAKDRLLDAHTEASNQTLNVHQIFDYKENEVPHPASYRKIIETSEARDIQFVSHEVYRPETSGQMRAEASINPKLFSGQIRLAYSDNWIPLPGLTCKDRLRHIHTHPKIDFILGYSKSEALYYVKPTTRFTKPVELSFTLQANLQKNPFFTKPVSPEISDLIQAFHFNPAEGLQESMATTLFRLLPQENQIKALQAYFHQFKEKTLQNPGNTAVDLLNAILREKAGVCRHRTLVFLKLARALNIPARGVFNGIHAFVEVPFQGRWHALDLGGGAAELVITPLPEDKPSDVAEQPIKNRQLALDNPFRTWDSAPFSAIDMTEYAAKLLQEAAALTAGSQNVLSVLDRQQIVALYTEISREKKADCYFIADLDDISEKATYIDNERGESRSRASALKKFLQKAKTGDILMVNWTECDSRHVGYNSMMDNPRKIKGMLIPEGVVVLGVIDQNQVMAEDFYSRFRRISKMPAHLPAKPLLPEDRPAKISVTTCVLDFYDEQWRATLLGKIEATEGSFRFVESSFVRALLAGSSLFVFRHAPWHLSEFSFFMTRVMTERKLEVNDLTYPLPENFSLLRDDRPFSLVHPRCTWQGYPCAIPPEAFLLNCFSFPALFQGYLISETGKLSSKPGLLAEHQGQKLTLFLTENFSDRQWAKILLQAREVDLALILAPGITLPQALQAKPAAGLPLVPGFAQCIVTNDVDFAAGETAKLLNTALVIVVHEKTTGADLFGMNLKTGTDSLRFAWREGPLTQTLREGKSVILKGSFSPALTKQLESLFLPKPYLQNNGNRFPLLAGTKCIMIRNDPAPTWMAQHSLNYSSEHFWIALRKQFPTPFVNRLKIVCKALEPQCSFGYIALKSMLEALVSRPQSNPLKSLLRLQPDYRVLKPLIEKLWIKTAPSKKIVLPLEEKRQILLESVLKNQWYAFVAGDSGVGKSTTIHKILKAMNFEMVAIEGSFEEQLLAWLTPGRKKALFIDEANLFDAAAFDVLEGLYENPPRLLVKGLYYPVPPENRLVFAGNFGHFSGRQKLNFIARHGNIITFKMLTAKFLQENIIGVVCRGLRIGQASEIRTLSIPFLRAFYHINGNARDNTRLTARNLQMMVLRYAQLRKEIRAPEQAIWIAAYEEIVAVCKPAVCKNFAAWVSEQTGIDVRKTKKDLKAKLQSEDALNPLIQIKTRVNPVRIFNQLMQIREDKIDNPALAQAGSNGLLMEGSPGIGKSYLALEYLRAQGFKDGAKVLWNATKSPNRCYYHLQGCDPEELKARLRKAFHEGAMVIIDEINTLPLEYILNALLSGKTPEGENPQNPGFFVIATQNPISFGKRQALSEAFSNRFQKLLLKDYNREDLTHITEIIAESDTQSAEILVHALLEAQQFAKEHQLKPEPTPRDLFEHAKHRAGKL